MCLPFTSVLMVAFEGLMIQVALCSKSLNFIALEDFLSASSTGTPFLVNRLPFIM